jgi:hypothetical protein
MRHTHTQCLRDSKLNLLSQTYIGNSSMRYVACWGPTSILLWWDSLGGLNVCDSDTSFMAWIYSILVLFYWVCGQQYLNIIWLIDPLLGKDLKTNHETTAIAMQVCSKHPSTTVELPLEWNLLLGSCNSWTTTMETGVFVWSVLRSYLEDNWGNPVSC